MDISWTIDQLQELRDAYDAVDPLSSSFWEKVAANVDSKDEEECREKWFSIMYPDEKDRGMKLNLPISSCQLYNEKLANGLDDDDIFHSTPMRALNNDVLSMENANLDSQFPFEFDAIISSPSHIYSSSRRRSSGSFSPLKPDIGLVKVGYKGYITKLARNRRGISVFNRTRRKKGIRRSKTHQTTHHVSIEERNIQMDALLSPGGTIKVDAPTESDLEDLIIRSDEELSECENY